MDNWLTLVTPIAAVGAVYVIAPVVAHAYSRFRGTRVVMCPESQAPTEIALDAMHAARTAAFGAPDARVMRCARWPERQGCGQACLSHVH